MDLRVARRRVIGGRETHSFIRGIGVSTASTTRVRSLARAARRILAREYFFRSPRRVVARIGRSRDAPRARECRKSNRHPRGLAMG